MERLTDFRTPAEDGSGQRSGSGLWWRPTRRGIVGSNSSRRWHRTPGENVWRPIEQQHRIDRFAMPQKLTFHFARCRGAALLLLPPFHRSLESERLGSRLNDVS